MATIVRARDKWLARVRRKGHAPASKVFETKALAEKWARNLEREIDQGRAGILTGNRKVTVGKLIERYVEEIGPVKPFGRNKADVLNKLKEWLQDVPIADLTPDRIVKYIRDERHIRGVTAAIDLTYLKGVLRVALALWRYPVHPPIVDDARELLRYMGMLERSNERDRRPSQDELTRVKAWLTAHSSALLPVHLDFLIASAMRPSEMAGLRWSDLNEADRTIVVRDRKDPRKKVGNNMTVPLLGDAWTIINGMERGEGRIFQVNVSTWSSIFPRACQQCDPPIVDLRLYDLRHEGISRLIEMNKYSIPEIMLISGHKDPKQLMRYTQLRARDLHRA